MENQAIDKKRKRKYTENEDRENEPGKLARLDALRISRQEEDN